MGSRRLVVALGLLTIGIAIAPASVQASGGVCQSLGLPSGYNLINGTATPTNPYGYWRISVPAGGSAAVVLSDNSASSNYAAYEQYRFDNAGEWQSVIHTTVFLPPQVHAFAGLGSTPTSFYVLGGSSNYGVGIQNSFSSATEWDEMIAFAAEDAYGGGHSYVCGTTGVSLAQPAINGASTVAFAPGFTYTSPVAGATTGAAGAGATVVVSATHAWTVANNFNGVFIDNYVVSGDSITDPTGTWTPTGQDSWVNGAPGSYEVDLNSHVGAGPDGDVLLLGADVTL
ncbi:MAG: hypothetical protein ACYDDF_00150 [Thermoplasmatota archaeon]